MLKVNNVIRLCLFADRITKRTHRVTLYKMGTKTKVIAANYSDNNIRTNNLVVLGVSRSC